MLEQRIDELETKLAFQDDLVMHLNDVVARQDQEIMMLRQDVERIRKQLLQMTPLLGGNAGEEPPPPHY